MNVRKHLARLVAGGLLVGGIANLATPPVSHAASCSIWTSAPTAGSGSISATSQVTCSSAVSQIMVRVYIQKTGGSFTENLRYCYNTTSCPVSVSVPYAAGEYTSRGGGEARESGGYIWNSSWTGGGTVTFY